MPRRSPKSEERRADADRSRRLLLSAAMDEFAEKGYAGARVAEIARRAGVNKQLITYYFGGKAGLYEELQRQWMRAEEEFASPDVPLGELLSRYLQAALKDPRGVRLTMWRSLSAQDEPGPDPWGTKTDLERMRLRKQAGEIAAHFDERALLLMMMGMVTAPILLADTVRELFGTGPDDPEFERVYGRQLRSMAEALAAGRNSEPLQLLAAALAGPH